MAAFASITSSVCKLALTALLPLMLFNEADAREQWRRPFQPVEDAVTFAELPAEARQTYQAILSGGPFQFDKDGSVFANRERLLPAERRGHYREYTVAAANTGRRGARRIVCGGVPRVPEMCWYTADHYASFKRIKQ